MALSLSGARSAILLGVLSLSSVASAFANYSSVDMMRAQLALMDERPKDCPPWYVVCPTTRVHHAND